MPGHGSPKVSESTLRLQLACPPHRAVSSLSEVGWRQRVDQESLGEEEEGDVDVEEGEEDGLGQTDKEKRPKLALTKCKVVPGWHERERMEPSQTNTFFLGLDSQLPARMASRITWSSSILLDFDLPWCDLVLLFVIPLLHCVTVVEIFCGRSQESKTCSPCGVYHLNCIILDQSSKTASHSSRS